MNKELQTKIKVLAIYEIIGGLAGIGLTFYLLSSSTTISFLLLFIILFIVGLYSYSIYCGVILYKDVRRGLKHSKINQLLQIISFVAFGYTFQYLSGVYLLLGMNLTQSLTFNFNFGISSSWKVSINTIDPTLALNVNIVAILLVVFIDKTQQKLKKFDFEQQFSFSQYKSSTELPNVQVSDTTEA